jgi:hypothetical protein
MPHHLSQGRAAPRILCMQAMSPIQGRQTPPTNQRATHGRHMDWRVHGTLTTSKPSRHRGTDLRTHRTATTRKHRPRWAHKGSTDPIGQPNCCVGSSWPSTWCCLVDPWVHSRGVGGASTSGSSPINRREGTHFLPNSSLTFGFQG